MAIGKTFILILGENEPFPNIDTKHPAIFLKKINRFQGKPTALLGFSDGYGNVFSSILSTEYGGLPGDSIDKISDVLISSPSNGQVLTYSADSQNWINQDSGGGSDLSINSQSGTTYTLALSDKNKLVELANGSAITLTIPPNSSVAFPIGSQILLYQAAAGQITVSASTGVTILSSGGKTKTNVQYSAASLVKTATNNWLLSGDITT